MLQTKFKINENIKITTIFHLLIFLLEDGHTLYSIDSLEKKFGVSYKDSLIKEILLEYCYNRMIMLDFCFNAKISNFKRDTYKFNKKLLSLMFYSVKIQLRECPEKLISLILDSVKNQIDKFTNLNNLFNKYSLNIPASVKNGHGYGIEKRIAINSQYTKIMNNITSNLNDNSLSEESKKIKLDELLLLRKFMLHNMRHSNFNDFHVILHNLKTLHNALLPQDSEDFIKHVDNTKEEELKCLEPECMVHNELHT